MTSWSGRLGVAFFCSVIACCGLTVGGEDRPSGGVTHVPDGSPPTTEPYVGSAEFTHGPDGSPLLQTIDARTRSTHEGDAKPLPPLGSGCGAESLDIVCHVYYQKADGDPPDSKITVNPSQPTGQTSGDGYTFAVTLGPSRVEPPILVIELTNPDGTSLFHQTYQFSARDGLCNSTGYGFTGFSYVEAMPGLEIQYYCEHVY